ncbi:hypothetical protein JMN32_19685 [Fulvivirga sp. 29W222]|uniref:Uncharacterized protein n=1 Tax=Fulvivirga marina TaxID=2494733 RepID=A0A937G0Z5_9BACT|nr:hypothetical protein [Fulvivirga marina]MBL6448542.1 hypothetical protein [Fulvivirga marina]
MNISIYKITTRKAGSLKGAAYILFKDDILSAVNWEFKRPLTDREKDIVRAKFPFNLTDLTALKEVFEVTEMEAKTAHDKLKLFCMYFKAKRGSTYTAKKQEKANIKEVVVTKGLLNTYFSNDSFPLTYAKSINDYIRHYNYIRDINRNGLPEKSKFPNEYDARFEKQLSPEELSQYWSHLRNLGFRQNDRRVWISPGKLDI